MINKYKLRGVLFAIPLVKKMYAKMIAKHGVLLEAAQVQPFVNNADPVFLDKQIQKNLRVGLVKDDVDFDGYVNARAYYPKYERLLRNNQLYFEYYDIKKSDWLEVAKKFDVIVWRTSSSPIELEEARNKIYVLEHILRKRCFPSFHELWTYENKINMHYLYKAHDLPEIPTFVSHSSQDTFSFIRSLKFPIISKIYTGSSSLGVEKISTPLKARKKIQKVFGPSGQKTYHVTTRQKDYVLFQKFINKAEFDLRVIVVGDFLFGYYRYPKKGSYKASGSGIVEKKEIPYEVLELAYQVKERFNTLNLSTDFLYSKEDQKYLIIESSIFIGVDTPEQLVIKDVPGMYKRIDKGEFRFLQGRIWIQELALKLFLEKYFSA